MVSTVSASGGAAMVAGVGVTKSFRRGAEEVHALRAVSFALHPGELVALVGPSGSGKSTLLNVLCGWEEPDADGLDWRGELAGRSAAAFGWAELALVPQALGLLADLTLGENVLLPARLARRLARFEDRAGSLLELFGVAQLAGRYPQQASLGEQQRCAVARALLLRPALLLADEPTAHQDAGWTRVLFGAFRDLVEGGSVCLVATHDPQTWQYADRCWSCRTASCGRAAPTRCPDPDRGWPRCSTIRPASSPAAGRSWRTMPGLCLGVAGQREAAQPLVPRRRPQMAAEQDQLVDAGSRPPVAGQVVRAAALAAVAGPPPAEGEVRAVPLTVRLHPGRPGGPPHGRGQPAQRRDVTVHRGPQHPGGAARRERAGPAQPQLERRGLPGHRIQGGLQAGQPVRVHLAEERDRQVPQRPGGPARPARQVTQRVYGPGQRIQRRPIRHHRHEQPHPGRLRPAGCRNLWT
jgi:putative ABC transport system ATP-binding protein